jgi:hypothetical protein
MRNRNAALRRKQRHLRELADREVRMWTEFSMRSWLELERRDGLAWDEDDESDIAQVVREYRTVWKKLAQV